MRLKHVGQVLSMQGMTTVLGRDKIYITADSIRTCIFIGLVEPSLVLIRKV